MTTLANGCTYTMRLPCGHSSCIVAAALGLMVTSKKRQEFRLKLQKRSRRKAEKRLENWEEEKHLLQVSCRHNTHVTLIHVKKSTTDSKVSFS